MRLFPRAWDIVVRLLVCAADMEDITKGIGTMPPSTPPKPTGSSPQQKRRRKQPGWSPFPLEKADLDFPNPPPNSTMAQLLVMIMDVFTPLFDDGSIFNPIGIDPESFVLKQYLMINSPFAGVYYLGDKIGRATNCKTRYEDPGDGVVICAYDKLPCTELDKIEKSLNNCFNFIEGCHFDGDFGQWLKKATIEDAQAKENDMAGISIFYCIYLDQALNNGGIEKLGVRKGLLLQHLESALQLSLECKSESIVHEHLHCRTYLAWLADNKKAIDEDLKHFQDIILERTDSKTLSDLTFEHIPDLCTWMPGYEFNSPEVLLDKLVELFKGKTFPVTADEIRSVVESPEDESGIADALCDDELNGELGALGGVRALVFLIFSKIGNFISATEIAYDLLFRVWCSKNVHWHDMYEARTERKDQFDPESLGEDEARKSKENQKKEIKAFQVMVDKCSDKKKVHWMRVDRMLSAYNNDNELKNIITTEFGMEEIHSYLEETTVYEYCSERGCMGLIFLHHAFSKSLSSLPPWDRNYTDEQFQDQGRAGIAFDWNQAVGLTFDRVEGHEDEMVSPNTLTESLLVAFVLRMYIIHRLHHGDYRIATLFAKDLATFGKDKYKRLEEIGLNQKWRNLWAKERRSNNLTYAKSHSQSKQIVNRLSGPR
eukprot:scaffold11315_cov73-Skeletonema_marinoi.AAC.2